MNWTEITWRDHLRWVDVQGSPANLVDIGDGPPLVFVHGALVNANLWRKVVPRLDGFTRVTLDLPLGSHLEPMPKGTDLRPPALAEEIADATIVIVAQRVNTIRDADRILVLDEGRVVGTGTHHELMADNETYREIVLSQLTEAEAA